MGYELLKLNNLIETVLYRGEGSDGEKVLAEIKDEISQVFQAIQRYVAKAEPIQAAHYLAQHQQAIGLLLEAVENKVQGTSAGDKILEDCITLLTDLLLLLRRHFPLQYNRDLIIPSSKVFFERLTACIEKFVLTATDKFEAVALAEATGMLSASLLNPVNRFTYRQEDFLESFFIRLDQALSTAPEDSGMLELILTIASTGFNHPLFYIFCCRFVDAETARCQNMNEQYRWLHFLKKKLAQVENISPLCFNENLPPITGSLSRYLGAELEYLKSMEAIATDLGSPGLPADNFKVNFTVRQLAIFIHLQVEADIITTKSPKSLHTYVTKHYSTSETENISEKSFKNAYYGYVPADVEKVIEKIAVMLAIAREKY